MMRHHLHMSSYFLGTFTEYPFVNLIFIISIKYLFAQSIKEQIPSTLP